MAQKPIGYYGEFRPTGVDQSAARRFQALAGLADQANELAFNVAAKKRAEQGQEAGVAAGIEAAEEGKPAEEKKGLLSSISIYDQAFNSAVEKSFVASIETDARENITRIAEESNGNFDTYEKLSTQYLNGLSGGISPDHKNILKLSLDNMVASAGSQVQSQQIVKLRQETDEKLINSTNSALDASIRLTSLGDSESAANALTSAIESINARVESGAISQPAADNLISDAYVTVDSAIGRNALINTYKERGAVAGVEYIQLIQDKPLKGFTVEQQSTLVDVLKQDLSQQMTLERIKEIESAENLTIRQGLKSSELFLGISEGTVDSGDIAVAARNGNISYTQLTQLTNTLNSRGLGIDDYSVIREAQNLIRSNPEEAQRFILENTNTSITGSTSQQLYQNAMNAIDSESAINTSKAKRFMSFLENSVVERGALGAIDFDSQERLAKLELVYNERVLAGEDPAIVASELIDVNELILNPIEDPKAKRKELLKSLKEEIITDSEYNEEIYKINNYENLKRNADAFQKALDQALKGQ